MKIVNKQQILDIINQMDDELLNNKDNSMSVYDLRKIAKCLLNAINKNTVKDKLNNLVCAIEYCGYVLPDMILERLYLQKILNKQKYTALQKWLEDAWVVYRSHHIPITKKELEEYLAKVNYSITKQRIKDVLHLLYDK